MTPVPDLHPLLARQLRKSGVAMDGAEPLLALVSAAYQEFDRMRARTDHANAIMADELDAAMASLKTQNLRFRAALDNMNQSLCLFATSGQVVTCNRRFCDLLGYRDEEQPIGKTLEQVLRDAPIFRQFGDDAVHGLLAGLVALKTNHKHELMWPDRRIIEVLRVQTAEGGQLLTLEDISEAKRASQQIAYLARHDALTDLPNRVLLRERLDEIIRNAHPDGQCAVIIMDLDRFKVVNDTLGHAVGDALLVEVANRLKPLIRAQDVIARLGGDEFAIILQHLDDPVRVSSFTDQVIHTISQPFNIKGNRIAVGASLGVSLHCIGTLDPAEALRQADVALYVAKADGRGVARHYTEELHQDSQTRLKLEADLREAMERGEFYVEYQPQLDLNTRRLIAAEALVRWQSPTRGLVMPDTFISTAEEIGLMDELGAFVLHTATRDALLWPDDVTVAVNLSPVQFRSGQLPQQVAAALERTGLLAHRLELEVTESLMIEDTANVLMQIEAIKRLGCRISLDDFGTGYSSLSYIRQFPFDKIKIDKVFVRDLDTNQDNLAIISAVSGLCASLAMQSVAEGVETAEQLEILHNKNIDTAQGFLIGYPMEAGMVATMMLANNGPQAKDAPNQRQTG